MNRRQMVKGLGAATLTASALASAAEITSGGKQMPAARGRSSEATLMQHDMSGYGIPDGPPQQIALLVYPQMTALDLIGPHQILSAMGNVQMHLVWKNKEIVVSDAGVPIQPTTTFQNCPDDLTVLFAPGGAKGTITLMNDVEVLDFFARKGKTAKYVTSVCTGSLILGAAGLLTGYKATSHWSVRDAVLPLLGATPVRARVVEDRNRITGAGVTAGLDFGLRLVAKLRNEKMAQAIQLGVEYDPAPPYHAGTPEGAGKEVAGMMRAAFVPVVEQSRAAALKARKQRGL